MDSSIEKQLIISSRFKSILKIYLINKGNLYFEVSTTDEPKGTVVLCVKNLF